MYYGAAEREPTDARRRAYRARLVVVPGKVVIGKRGGHMSPAQVLAALRASADNLGTPGRDDYFGLGRVHALRAVQ